MAFLGRDACKITASLAIREFAATRCRDSHLASDMLLAWSSQATALVDWLAVGYLMVSRIGERFSFSHAFRLAAGLG